MYGAEKGAGKGAQKEKLDVAGLSMSRWMCRVARQEQMREYNRKVG